MGVFGGAVGVNGGTARAGRVWLFNGTSWSYQHAVRGTVHCDDLCPFSSSDPDCGGSVVGYIMSLFRLAMSHPCSGLTFFIHRTTGAIMVGSSCVNG